MVCLSVVGTLGFSVVDVIVIDCVVEVVCFRVVGTVVVGGSVRVCLGMVPAGSVVSGLLQHKHPEKSIVKQSESKKRM